MDQDILSKLSSIAAILSFIIALVQLFKEKKFGYAIKNIVFTVSIILTIIFIILALWFWLKPCEDQGRYGFEKGPVRWTIETDESSQGVINLSRSNDQAKFCKHSLKLMTNLEGGHRNRSKGEAYIEFNPQNLEEKPITIWVFVPDSAIGERQHPNGLQVFVKDINWQAEYGTWNNITPQIVEQWEKITLTPSRVRPIGGYIDQGFDPTQIKSIGIKIAIGDSSASTYRGPIYIDSVDW